MADAAAREFNSRAPIGTIVRYWRGLREGDGRRGRTRSIAYIASSGDAVVFIEGCSGYVALTHVDLLDVDDNG
jgi:hypothetical protein